MICQKYSILFGLVFLPAAAFSVRAQNSWADIALAAPQAKIISTPRIPRFSVGLSAGFPLGRPAVQNIDFQNLQSVFQSPELGPQLFEQFGGLFFIGNVPGRQAAGLSGRFQAQPGAFASLHLPYRLSLRVSAQHYRAAWSGTFPVLVLPFSQNHGEPAPQTLQGRLDAWASAWLGEAAIGFNFPGRVLQPFVEGGVRGIFPNRSEASAMLAGVTAPIGFQAFERSFSVFGGAGLRVFFWKNGFVQTAFSIGERADGAFSGELRGGLGWCF